MKNISKSILLKVLRILDCHMYNLKKIRFSNLRTKAEILQRVNGIYRIQPNVESILFKSKNKFIRSLQYSRLTKKFYWDSLRGEQATTVQQAVHFQISHIPQVVRF